MTVLAVVSVLYTLEREWRKLAVTTVVAIVTVGMVGFVVGLQPSNPSQLISYGIHEQGPLFLRLNWWLTHLPAEPPSTIFHIGITALLPATVLAAVLWGMQFYRRRSDIAALLTVWHASALSLPFLLPAGFLAHEYYLWPTVAPMAITFGIIGSRLPWRTADGTPSWRVVTLVFLVAISATGGQVVTTEYGPLDQDTPPRVFMNGQHEYESYGAGRRIARYQNDGASVAFIGPEFRDHGSDNYAHAHGRVLVYSDLLIRERAPGTQGGRAIYVDNMSQLRHCTMYVHRQERELVTDRCAELNINA